MVDRLRLQLKRVPLISQAITRTVLYTHKMYCNTYPSAIIAYYNWSSLTIHIFKKQKNRTHDNGSNNTQPEVSQDLADLPSSEITK